MQRPKSVKSSRWVQKVENVEEVLSLEWKGERVMDNETDENEKKEMA